MGLWLGKELPGGMYRHGKKPGETDQGQKKHWDRCWWHKEEECKRDNVREIAWGKAVGVFQGKDTESEIKVRYVSKIK